MLDARIPASLREPGGLWFGFSLRARLIAYNKAKVKAGRSADLRIPRRAEVEGPHLHALVDQCLQPVADGRDDRPPGRGEGRGVGAGRASAISRATPKGGDTDQLKAWRRANATSRSRTQYYYARLLRSGKPEERAVAEKVGVVCSRTRRRWGAHVNISGAGVMKHAPHREAAVKFLEYLASDEAQRYFAEGNNEWPVVAGVKIDNPVLEALGEFRRDTLNVARARPQPAGARRKSTTGSAWK